VHCKLASLSITIRAELPTDVPLTLSPVRSLAGYCDEFGFPRREVIPEQSLTIRGPDAGGGGLAGAVSRVRVPPAYVAEIPGAQVTGLPYLLVGSDDTVLSDLWAASLHGGKNNGWQDDSIVSLVVFSSHARRSVLWCSGVRKAGPVPEGISLVERAESTWFNFVYQVAPKLMLVDRFREYDHLPLLVGDHLPPQARELLEMLNDKRREIISLRSLADNNKQVAFTAGKITRVKGRSLLPPATYRFERLVVPSPMALLRPYRSGEAKPDDHLINPAGIRWLREKLLPKAERGPLRRIYLSRARQARRRLLNEDQVLALLVRCGFEVVYPEKLSFREQLNLFANAEAVIGLAGSAFSGMIFSPAGAKFVVIASGNPFPVCHRADMLGFTVRFIPAASRAKSEGTLDGQHDDVKIELGRLRSVLSALGLDAG